MKKFGLILAALVILTFVGCASSGGGNAAPAAAAPYSVDLSTLKVAVFSDKGNSFGAFTAGKRNIDPLPAQYDGALFDLGTLPDVTGYSRITIRAKYYSADGTEMAQGDGNAMVVLIYDINGDKKGPEMGAGPNTPLKEFNLGGFSGQVSSDRGSRISLSKNPGAILLQCSNGNVKFLELVEVTFHN